MQHTLTEHGHVLQWLETPAAPQGVKPSTVCVAPQVKGGFSAKGVQDSEAAPGMFLIKR